MGGGWDDDFPWYAAESLPPRSDPGAKTELAQITNAPGGTIFTNDTPGDNKGGHIEFDTYLVSVFADNTYQIMGGFHWGGDCNKLDPNPQHVGAYLLSDNLVLEQRGPATITPVESKLPGTFPQVYYPHK